MVLRLEASTFSRDILLVNLQIIALGCLRRPLSVVALRCGTLCAISMSEPEISFLREENSLRQRLAVSSADSIICGTVQYLSYTDNCNKVLQFL